MTAPDHLPANVYRLPQAKFEHIPTSPWVYWVSDDIRNLFTNLPNLNKYAKPWVGLQTSDNVRFLRFWWEAGISKIGFGYNSTGAAQKSNKRWFPYMKGGAYRKWYGNQDYIVNWFNDGQEMKGYADFLKTKVKSPPGNGPLRDFQYYFQQGATWTYIGSSDFSARICPGGFIFDTSGSCAFPNSTKQIPHLLAVMNSSSCAYILQLLNPTINNQVGDLARIPIPITESRKVDNEVTSAIHLAKSLSISNEKNYDFIASLCWDTGIQKFVAAQSHQAELEIQINDHVYKLYGISPEERRAIELELGGGIIDSDEEEPTENKDEEAESTEPNSSMTQQELAVRLISYTVGVVLGNFQPGVPGSLGSAIYRRSDFTIGSLPTPSEDEFNELVGTPDKFTYTDANGGRHVFAEQVEQSLQALRFEDGVAVLDAGHPRDLVARVYQALELMLGQKGAAEVIQTLGGEATSPTDALRKFLEKDYFTGWHFKWYRKRPVYWPVQSAKRAYGFVLFQEKVTRDTFYAIQREPYLDTKRNAVANAIGDLETALRSTQGAERKRKERDLDDLRKLAAELDGFAKDLESITKSGYNTASDWIDDGIILRLAPLWKVIPIWKTEPKKYWERLEAGEFDWSHIAMNYWPERVKAKCKTNKSYAIAHGHEEWYSEN